MYDLHNLFTVENSTSQRVEIQPTFTAIALVPWSEFPIDPSRPHICSAMVGVPHRPSYPHYPHRTWAAHPAIKELGGWAWVAQGNVRRFRGGLIFKAHRLCVSLNSRLESNKEEEEGKAYLAVQEIGLRLSNAEAGVWSSSSVRLNLGSSLLFSKQDLQYELTVHLPLSAFHAEPNLARTKLGVAWR